MTKDEALELARAKWGEKAYAHWSASAPVNPYAVGCPSIEVGYGASWRAACVNAGLIPKDAV